MLLWLGRIEEACGLLERAHVVNSGNFTRALNACCLAMAYAKRGDLARARDWLEQARRDDPGCSLITRAMASLQGEPIAAAS